MKRHFFFVAIFVVLAVSIILSNRGIRAAVGHLFQAVAYGAPNDSPSQPPAISNSPGVAIDSQANIYFSASGQNKVFKMDASGTVSVLAGTGLPGFTGDGGLAGAAQLNTPEGVAVDGNGSIYIADQSNHVIRVVNTGSNSRIVAGTAIPPGSIVTVAGTGNAGYDQDGIVATSAALNNPAGVGVDSSGNIYIADQGNQRIRRVDGLTGIISTVAGTGTAGYDQDGVAATSAGLSSPSGVGVDSVGNIYIADQGNQRIRRVDASTGLIGTVAGTGTVGFDQDGISATSAALSNPAGVGLDSVGNIYIADQGNQRIRRVDASTGIIGTVAGTGIAGYDQDGIAATGAELNLPSGVALDSSGNFYVADRGNQRIRVVNTQSGPISVAGVPVDSGNVATLAVLTHFVFSAATTATVGNSVDFTVTAQDLSNSPIGGYNGTVHFTSSDSFAVLPPDSGLTDGSATLQATFNTGGNQTITAVDAVNPSVRGTSSSIAVSSAPSFSGDNSATFTVGNAGSFTITATGSPTPSLTSTSVLPTGVTFVDNGDGTGTLSGTPGAGTGGVHGLIFQATNTAGNPSDNFTLTIDESPSITSTDTANFTVGISGSFGVTASGYPAPSLTLTGTLPAQLAFASGVLSGVPGAGTGGTYNGLQITATNSTGSFSQAFTLNVIQPAAAGISAIAGTPQTALINASYASQFQVKVLDDNGYPVAGARVTFSTPSSGPSGVFAGGVNTAATNTDGIATAPPFTANGIAGPFTVSATIAGVSTAATFSLTNTESPSFTSLSNATFTVGTQQSFPATTAGFPAPAVSESGALPSGLLFNAGVIGGTPLGGTGGTYSLTLSATNGVLPDATQNFTLTVNQAPGITSTNGATFTVGTQQTFSTTTTGFPAPTVSETGTLPTGLVFSSGVISGIPAAGTGGAYSLILGATNGVSPDAAQNFTLSVNQPPEITIGNSATFVAGTQKAFSVTTTGFPAPTVTETGPLPDGLIFVAGTLSGTPIVGTGGTYNISFTATNSSGSDTKNFMLTVNQSSAFTSAPLATFTAGIQQQFAVTATGFPAPTVSLSSGMLPPGLTLNSGVISGVPTVGTGGVYAFTLTAVNGVGGGASQNFTLTVNQAPAILSANTVTFTAGSPQSFQVLSTGFPSPLIAESGPLPSGLAFNSGVLGGTALAGTDGTYPISFSASNGVGVAAQQNFTLIVLPPPIAVSVAPVGGTLYGGQSRQFAAVVLNTTNHAVTWSIAPAVGTLSTSGFYTAPSTIATTQAVTITATSIADHTKSASASVTLMPPITVSITPPTPTLGHDQTQQFTAIVQNSPATLTLSPVVAVPAVSYDNSGTGANLGESVLTLANVANSLSRVGSFAVDGYIYAQPLFVGQVNISDGTTHDLLIVATMSNTLFAFDANNPGSSALWSTNFGPAFTDTPDETLLYSPTGVGIVSTPVIDVSNRLIYVVHATPTPSWVLEKIDLTSGHVLGSSPITGQVPGGGDAGDPRNGPNLLFYPRYELQRPGLTLANGRVYIAFGSWDDARPEHGWIFAYDAGDLTQKGVLCLSPNSWGAAIWQSGGGLTVDSLGNLYATTGNGAGTSDFSEAIVKMDPDLNIVDWFKPSDWTSLSSADQDFSIRPILVPGLPLLIAGAKNSNVYGLNPNNLGGFAGPAQVIRNPTNFGMRGAAVFNGKLYSGNGNIFANPISGTTIGSSVIASANMYAQPIALSGSCNGSTNCIVWATTVAKSAVTGPQAGTFRAFDANTLVEIYNSDTAPNGADTLGILAKFIAPVVINGHVYIPTQDNVVQVYGVPLSMAPPPANPTGVSVDWLITPNIGAISASGLYTAPTTITGTKSVTVTAVSVADWTKSANTTVTLKSPISVTLNTSYVLLNPGQAKQFSATLQNTTNQSVTWSISSSSGTISGTGLYTAPATISNPIVTVTATSMADPTVSAVATVVLTTSSVTPPSGLAAYWTFDNADDAGAVAQDRSGNNGNGAILGSPAQISGKLNQGLSFNGLSTSVAAPSNSATSFTTSVTMAAWIRTTNVSRPEAILSKYSSAGSGAGYLFRTNANGNLEVQLGNADVTGTATAVDTTKVNDGQWHHVVAIITIGQNVKFYVDNKLSSTIPILSMANGDNGAPLTVGLNPFTFYGNYFTGDIDEVRLYNRALSPSEVGTLYLLSGGIPPAPVASIAVTPTNSAVNVGNTQQFVAMGSYQDNSTADVSSQVAWNSSNIAAATIGGAGLAIGQAAGSANITATLNGITSNSATLTVNPPVCPCTIWNSIAVPTTVDSGAGGAVELGVKFRADLNGTITGIRFYKSSANTGTHIGSLWTSNGTLLATATFSNESASGWQQVTFSHAVAIAANTVYVASYHTNVSHFSVDLNAFTSSGVDAPPLHALANGVSGSNGLFLYSITSAFPTNTYSASNYWVDVIFSTAAPSPLTSIAVAPSNSTVNVGANRQFAAIGTYQDGSTQDISAQVTWSSGSTTAATINSAGLATGQAAGSSNITATLNSITSNTATLTVQPVPPPTCPCTIWSSSTVPTTVDSGAGGAVELGVKLRSDISGTITGIRFFKSSANTGTHVGNLWSSNGTLLATATFTSESASGWQQVNFSSPVAITANTVYVASYHTNVSHFSVDLNMFSSSGVDAPPLRALANGVSGSNGLYLYSNTSAFPTNTYNASNYWVDVVFSTTVASPLVSIAVTPANQTVNAGTNQQFTATGTYQDNSTQDISTQVSWSSSNTTAATINSAGLATGQAVGSSNITAMLNSITSNTATLTVQPAPPPTCPCTLWSSSTVPTTVDSGAGGAVELGVKFRSDISGTITGIRFFKSSANTGTHIGSLWSSNGTLLATATFTNELASGWQQVTFSHAIAIAANTVYVASYHTNVSHFSVDLNMFSSSGVDAPPLRALANGVSGSNGLYLYSNTSAFPTNTYNASNYWVDVVFSTTVASPLVSIAVTPANQTVNAGTNQQFTATGTYQDNSTQDISTQVSWSSSNTTAATINSAGLATGQAASSSNITATLNSITSNTAILTVNPPVCPCSIWSTSTIPAVVDSGAGGAVELGVKFRSDVSGKITGLRFYKSSANTGTHVGNLWSSNGTLLATAVFTGESSSGWQQVNFSTPVSITANTVYVVSYHTNVSHFGLNLNAFVPLGVDNAPLHVLSNGASGGNGVYLYSSTSGFPANTYSASNYWVDVIFQLP